MSEFAPPTGPPPPKVPEGWKAVYNEQYKEWFYVNLYTKQSTWEKPTAPAQRPDDDAPPAGPPPPSYSAGPNAPNVGDTKKPLDSNNPYARGGPGDHKKESDEEMARRLQREENDRTRGHSPNPQSLDRGQADSYYNSGPGGAGGPGGYQQSSYQQSTLAPGQQPYGGGNPAVSPGGSQQRGGFFDKLKDKFGGGAGGAGGYPPRPASYGQQQPYMGQQQYGGGYPQQGYQQGYGGYQQQGYGGYQQQQQPAKKSGLGAGGAAALGVGGGLLGGMLLADAMEHHDQNEYNEGFEQGQMDGGDYGGGDFGGDF